MSSTTIELSASHRLGLARAAAWIGLCVVQALTISWLFEVPQLFPAWGNPFTYVRNLVVLVLIAAAGFGVLAWPRRNELIAAWSEAQAAHDWRPPLLANLALFALLSVATAALTRHAAVSEPSVAILVAWSALLAATAVSLLRIDVDIASAFAIVRRFRSEAMVATAAGLGVQGLAALSIHGWEAMAEATLVVARSILELYETGVVVDAGQRMIRIGDFAVIVTRYCSGYEGIALVCGFLSIYLWVFRGTLAFPRAFLLYPIGIVAIWLLNCLRIALLASLGAHVSPHMAVQGFHSQAGWIAFLAATLGIMALAQRSRFFAAAGRGAPAVAATTGKAAAPARADDTVLLAHLVPFMGLMLGSIVLAAVAPHDRPLYGVKVVLVLAALWAFRRVYLGWRWSVSREAVVAGLIVGLLWIATDPDPGGGGALAAWLAQVGPAVAAVWLLVRAVGTVLAVPIAEELAFRGFLQRWLVARDFDKVPHAALSILAIAVSATLFGLMHERWLAGLLAGVAFSLVMLRTRDISGPVVAHMVANAAILAWALAFRQWSLL